MNTSPFQVIDDYADIEELKPLFEGEVWAYGWTSRTSGDTFPFWHIHFCGSTSPRKKDLHDSVLETTPHLAPLHDLWSRIKSDLAPDYGLLRAYANGHTFGLEGHIHTDCNDDEDELTALIYANDTWKNQWAGETVFFDDSSNPISVGPKPGRLVLFNGSIPHAARAPSRDCPQLRVTLVFKMRRVRAPSV